MRKLIVSMNVSLDGYISGIGGELDWQFSYWTDKMTKLALQHLDSIDTILLGRKTYETMAGYWPSAAKSAYADKMNSCKKIVFSRSLHQLFWEESQLSHKNMLDEISDLKLQPGKDMIIFGSRSIVSTLMKTDLINEYILWVHPVLIGKGVSLFDNLTNTINLHLFNSKIFGSGVVVLYYMPGTIEKANAEYNFISLQ